MENEIEDEAKNITKFQNGIQDGKHVFVLFYMSTCGPCKETKPKWIAFEKSNSDDDVVITHIEMNMLDKIDELIGEQPSGFPTMRYIANKGKISEDYPGERKVNAFVLWIKSKLEKESNLKIESSLKKKYSRKYKNQNYSKKKIKKH